MATALASSWNQTVFADSYQAKIYDWPKQYGEKRVSNLRTIRQPRVLSAALALRSWWKHLSSILCFLLALVVALVLGSLIGIGINPSFTLSPVNYFSHTVVSGDSLWNLATANVTTVPAEEAVSEMMRVNHLSSASVLQTGQRLLIPIY